MTVKLHVPFACEVISEDGPTGDLVEVLEVQVCDAGGNVLWQGPPKEQPDFRMHVTTVAIKTGVACASADCVV